MPRSVRAVSLCFAALVVVAVMSTTAFAGSNRVINGCEIVKRTACPGANLAGTDLRKAILIGADLRKADLRGAKLSGADLRGALLVGARLSGGVFTGANFRGANLAGAVLGGGNFNGANFREADLTGARSVARRRAFGMSSRALSPKLCTAAATTTINTQYKGANLDFANLSYALFKYADFTGASMHGVNLSHANMTCNFMVNVDASSRNGGKDWESWQSCYNSFYGDNPNFSYTVLNGSDLTGAKLGGTAQSTFVSCSVAGPYGSHGTITRPAFTVDLTYTNLMYATLTNTNLRYTQLGGVWNADTIWSNTTCPNGSIATGNACPYNP